MTMQPHIAILPFDAVYLHPVNKAIPPLCLAVTQHQPPCSNRACCPPGKPANGPFKTGA